ncbi:zinc finger protein 410 isoform X2 [Ornithorhynchus anatinus]|uniref:zinc finger protein 410 isoform X2 n=1 Tax=Ornithorhynchus anatinus TaxID=9258 RepID=UPI0010A91C8C|nr:zinc finger protein 410 isoform X2 [Ornithorhynchus anatinus]
MLSDELESKPELLVQFVQNTAIPLGQGLVESEPKDIACLSLLPVTDTSECSRLLLPDDGADQTSSSKEIPPSAVLRSVQVSVGANGEETRAGPPQKPPGLLSGPDPPGLLQDLQPGDSTSFILLNLTRAGLGSSAEHLVFVQDEAEDSGNDFLSGESADGSPPWFLRVQELAHDSLIAATRAQLARNAKAGGNGESVHLGPGEGQPKESAPVPHLPRVEKRLKCTVEGCDRTFVWPAHFKYHLKTHRNERSFACPAEGCGKSFYVLQRLKVHMRTHNGEKPFTCQELGCGKQFTTAGNLKNHLRIHTGEKPFLCEAEGCGRSFAEYSSLRKHLVVHSGVKPHQCQVCGKTFSQSGSRNVHVRRHHSRTGPSGARDREPTAEPLLGSSLLEAAAHAKSPAPGAPQPGLGVEPLQLPDADPILTAEEEVLAGGSSRSLPPTPDGAPPQPHHLVTLATGRQAFEVSALLHY